MKTKVIDMYGAMLGWSPARRRRARRTTKRALRWNKSATWVWPEQAGIPGWVTSATAMLIVAQEIMAPAAPGTQYKDHRPLR